MYNYDMKTPIKIIIALVVLALLIGGYFLFVDTPKNDSSETIVEKTLNPISGEKVGEALPKTNPFDTKVNPYDSYKNPFGN